MKKYLLSLTFMLGILNSKAQDRIITVDIWQEKPPYGNNGITAAETTTDGRVANITQPEMYLYLPEKEIATGTAVLITPGGGYGIVAIEHEGHAFARFLSSRGIAAAVLKYRLPNCVHDVPLADAKQAMKILHKYAGKWGISKDRIGVMGFSAGGHLAATLSTKGSGSSRPDFSILFYPVVSFTEDFTHTGSRWGLLGDNPSLWRTYSAECNINSKTPPALLFHSSDDSGVSIKNSEIYAENLRKSGVEAQLITYPTGGHGWGFNSDFAYHEQMKTSLLDYLLGLTAK